MTGGKKPAAAAKGKTKAVEEKKLQWTAADEAARKIQTAARGFLTRKKLKKLKKEKEEYEKLMDELEKEVKTDKKKP